MGAQVDARGDALDTTASRISNRPEHVKGAKGATAFAIEGAPNDDDYQLYINRGALAKGRSQALLLVDSGKQFGNAMGAMAASMNHQRQAPTSSGFIVNVYTPLTWAAQQASEAAKEYRPFLVGDLTDEMREAVLRVVVFPDTPSEVSARGMSGTQSVQHVVLRNEKHTLVVQPIVKDDFNNHVSNAMGGMADYNGVTVLFPLEGVAALRGPDGNSSFLITVIAEGHGERNFTIKPKHFERLP